MFVEFTATNFFRLVGASLCRFLVRIIDLVLHALPPKKAGFLRNLRVARKYFCKKTRFLGPHAQVLRLLVKPAHTIISVNLPDTL